MRVAFVAETWLPCTDGVITRLLSTCRELVRAGHVVLVVCPRPQPHAGGSIEDPRRPAGVQVRTVPTIGASFLYGGQRWGLPVPAVSRYLREFAPDVVHVVNPVFLGAAGVLAARRQHVPLVASYHTDVATYAGYYHLGRLRPLIRLVVRWLHNSAVANLATSRMGQAELTGHGVDGVELWPRGVDLELFHPGPATPRSQGHPTALYVGRLAPEKGLGKLRGLSEPDSGIDLLVVGEGPQSEELRTILGRAARFTGVLHGSALADAYRSADVFVFPSTTDTLGLVVLEAMASGLPVVAVESAASTELLGDCAAARLVPATDPDAITTAAAELVALRYAEGSVISDTARRFAHGCTWSEATASLVECYSRAIREYREATVTVQRRTSRRPAGPAELP
ncbi:MAG: glycosyltransferase family 4 protein [Marmoricola sp.]